LQDLGLLPRPALIYPGCMSDQQPTPETPRPGDGPAASGPAVPPQGAVPPPPIPPPPPVWPAHAAGDAGQGAAVPPAYPPAPGYAYPPPPGYPAQGYAYPAPGYAPAPTTSTNAIVGLVLAITSWIVCPIILAIVALVLAKKSGEEIAASQGRVGGGGLNTATKILSWINIGLYAAILVIVGAAFLIALVAGAASGR